MRRPVISVGYVRCSTEMQEGSISQQKQAIQAWAELNGHRIVRWYEDEARSGTSFDMRPGFMTMVRAVEAVPDFECVLVYDESRWGRAGDPRENTYWKVHLQRHSVKVRVINSQSKHENDLGSFVTEVVESAEASEYSKKLSRSTMRGCIGRAESGRSSGGTAPYGYRRVALSPTDGSILRELSAGVHRRKGEEIVSLVPGPPLEVNVVRQIFDLKSSGLGFRSIADRLNADKVPSARRGRWKNKDQKWSAGTIRSIIQNPVYYGTRAYNRYPKNKLSGLPRGKRNPPSEWVVKENAHPPLVTKALFEAANAQGLLKFGGGHAMVVKSEYLLSGLIKCSHCGYNYSGYSRPQKNLRYYADSGYIAKGKSVCEWHVIPKSALEKFVLDAICDHVLDSSYVAELEELINTYFNGRGVNPVEQQLDAMAHAIAGNENSVREILRLTENGIKLETVLPRLRELELEQERLRAEHDKIKRIGTNRGSVEDAASEAGRFIEGLRERLTEATIFEKKMLIRKCVDGIVVNRKGDEVVCTLVRIPKIGNPVLESLRNGVSQSNVCPEQGIPTLRRQTLPKTPPKLKILICGVTGGLSRRCRSRGRRDYATTPNIAIR